MKCNEKSQKGGEQAVEGQGKAVSHLVKVLAIWVGPAPHAEALGRAEGPLVGRPPLLLVCDCDRELRQRTNGRESRQAPSERNERQ